MERHKFGNVQQSMRSRSRAEPDLEMTLTLWRQCLDIHLCEVSSQSVDYSLRNGAKCSG